MPKKPHKWGYKVFSRCGASGMLYEFEVYLGKSTVQSSELGVTGDLVMRLCENLPHNKNHKVYFDNYFTSLKLLQELKNKGILALGTIRPNRMLGAQKLLKTEKVLKNEGRGSYDWRVDCTSDVRIMKWNDNSTVHFASTFIGCELGEKAKRWSSKDKEYILVDCPKMVHEYNKFMGGVDLNDMLLSQYRIRLKSNKWYMAIFYYVIKVAVTNGWLLYRRHQSLRNAKFVSLLEFQIEIASCLVKAGKLPTELMRSRGRTSLSEPKPKRSKTCAVNPIPSKDIRHDALGHFPKVDEKQHRCRHCSYGYTKIFCTKCQIFLCLTKDRNCFYSFHKK
ncbi:UNVERIFIED_CONTAM: hypothetical protein GTU68_050401 [Idotea baltica]|nr:hypothetical protein [Idotea baltica]